MFVCSFSLCSLYVEAASTWPCQGPGLPGELLRVELNWLVARPALSYIDNATTNSTWLVLQVRLSCTDSQSCLVGHTQRWQTGPPNRSHDFPPPELDPCTTESKRAREKMISRICSSEAGEHPPSVAATQHVRAAQMPPVRHVHVPGMGELRGFRKTSRLGR